MGVLLTLTLPLLDYSPVGSDGEQQGVNLMNAMNDNLYRVSMEEGPFSDLFREEVDTLIEELPLPEEGPFSDLFREEVGGHDRGVRIARAIRTIRRALDSLIEEFSVR